MTGLLPLILPALLFGVLVLVLVADLLLPTAEKRGLGPLAAAGVLGVFLATFWLDTPGTALGGGYAVDALTLFLDRLFLGAAFLGILGSTDHVARHYPARHGEYLILLLASVFGMMMLAGARDLILLTVAFETAGIPLYALAALPRTRDGRSTEAALKLYLVGATSTVIGLYGLSLIYGMAGTTSIAALAAVPSTPLLRVGMLAMLAGLSFKLGLVPFHLWVPDAYEGTSTPFTAFLSVAPKVAGFAAFLRLFTAGLLPLHGVWLPVLLVLSAASMILGNLIAVPQRNVKRLLAGSGIAQVGTMLLAFVLGNTQGVAMLLFYLTAYVVTNMGAFLAQEVLGDARGSDDVDAWRGMARTAPALSLLMLLFLLSLGGIPFMVGFWAKLQVYVVAWQAGHTVLVVLAAVLAVAALFYYLRVARAIYIEPPAEGAVAPAASLAMRLALGICLVGVIGIGLVPGPFVQAALEAARALI